MGVFHQKKPDPRREEQYYSTSREYKIFQEVERAKLNWYERTVQTSGRVLKLTPDQKSRERLDAALAFTGLRVTSSEVMGSFVLAFMVFVLLGVMLIVVGGIPPIGGLVIAALGAPAGYFLYKYPTNMVKELRIKSSAQIVLAVLYMVVSMRISPNLERALRFAAANVTGALAWDMRRLLWGIELKEYFSAQQALDDYMVKWKQENEEFAEALRLIKDSESQTAEQGERELDEALTVILEGTKTRMKHYSQDLMMPVMVIHMMGIVLPILGAIMAPLAAVFLSDLVSPIHFVIGYDIVLPIVLMVFIHTTLNKRPMTFSQVDISDYPDLPKNGWFRFKNGVLPAWPFGLLAALVFLIPALLHFAANPTYLLQGIEGREITTYSLMMSLFIILGVGIGLAVYLFLSNFQRVRVEDDIRHIESEFELALFQLGNRISTGTPTEVAIERSIDDMKDLKIAGLFQLVLRNIRMFGMTFENALFDQEAGAMRFYPSRMVRNIMLTVTETARKGVSYAAESMLKISRYLANIRETQEFLRDILSETVSSMKFQAYFLTPIITGLIVSMTSVITKILGALGRYLETVGFGDQLGVVNVAGAFGNMKASTPPELFQLIVGVYLIEVIFILVLFMTKISIGENKTQQYYQTGIMLMVSLVVYTIVALLGDTMFGGIIGEAIANLGIE